MKKRFFAMLLIACFLLAEVPVFVGALTTTVRVGYCSYMAPYQYTDATGQAKGFHVDVLEKIAEQAGLLTEYFPFNTTSEAINALQNGEIDLVLGVPNNQFASNNIRYTDVIAQANFCLLASHEIAAEYRASTSKNYPTALEYNSLEYRYLTALSVYNFLQIGNQKACVEALLNSNADLLVAVKECAIYYLEQFDKADSYQIINNYIASADYTIVVRNGDVYLCEAINSALAELRTTGVYESLHGEWFTLDSEIAYRKLIRIGAVVLSIIAVFITSYLVWSMRAKRYLAKLVEERTAELLSANYKLEQRMKKARAESELRHSIIEASPAGMILFDEMLHIEYMNRNAMEMAGVSGYTAKEKLSEIPFLNSILEQVNEELFANDFMTYSGNFAYGKNDSRKYRYNLRKFKRFDETDAALLTVEDITVEEREREAFFEKEKNKTLNNLIAGIAHEIKNPLTAISASADMIQTKGDNEKFRKAFSQYIPQEIARITRLINNLIDYARPSQSKIERVELTEVLKSICELAHVSAKDTDITLEMRENSLPIVGDRDRIKQALFNIVLNSLESVRHKASQEWEKPVVRITTGTQAEAIFITIYDNGVGMNEEELRRCTEPFYTTKPAGTGIGLAITQQYIEENGGTLKISSEKNKYTCVEIRLPRGEAQT